MISALGYVLSAASPYWLIAAPVALGLLIYIYRRRGPTREAVVSSLFLLSKLPEGAPAQKRFVPPLQFWLELLAFIALTAAAAKTTATKAGKHVAVVIDGSTSMLTRQGSGERRFEIAKTSAEGDILASPPETRFTVYSASDKLTPLTPSDPVGRSSAEKIIRGISPTRAPDKLPLFLGSLLSDPDLDAVWVYTDHTSPATEPRANLKVSSATASQPNELSNVWISDVRAEIEGEVTHLRVSLRLSAPSEKRVSVGGTCTEDRSHTGTPLPSKEVMLQPGSEATVQLDPPKANWTYCEVHTTIITAGGQDALPEDDIGWISRTERSKEVALVSALSVSALGLDRIPNTTVVARTSSTTPETPTIYHRSVPATRPSSPTLIVFPPLGPLPWGGSVHESSLKGVPITRWVESHPTLQYLNMPLLTLPSLRRLECPPGATDIANSPEGAVACAGEDGGKRYFISGIELFPFEGMKSPSLSIFTLNVFRWLFRTATSVSDQTGAIDPPPWTATAELINTDKHSIEITPNQSVHPTEPGIIAFRSEDGSKREFRTYNSFSDEESDIALPHELSIPTVERTASAEQRAATLPLFRWLGAAALGVLLFDLLRRVVSKKGWRR